MNIITNLLYKINEDLIKTSSGDIDVSIEGTKISIKTKSSEIVLNANEAISLANKLIDISNDLPSGLDFSDLSKVFGVDTKVLDQLEKWHKKYVPESGTASSFGGNVVRNISNVMYRYYNDGDIAKVIGRDPGKIVNPAFSALRNALYSFQDILNISYTDKEFDNAVEFARNGGKYIDEKEYAKELGKLATYLVNLLNMTISLGVFNKRSISSKSKRY